MLTDETKDHCRKPRPDAQGTDGTGLPTLAVDLASSELRASHRGQGDPTEFYFDVAAAKAATSGVEAVPIDCDCLYELEVTTIEHGVERMDAA